jgi:hypothetical protein
MANVCLDPYVLMTPDCSSGCDDFVAFIDTLLVVSQLRDRGWVKLCMLANTADTLVASGSYPAWEPVSTALKTCGIHHIQTRDVTTLVNSLMANTETVETLTGLSDLLADPIQCEPASFLTTRPPLFIEGAYRMFAFVGIGTSVLTNARLSSVVFSRNLGADMLMVSVNGQLVLCDDNGTGIAPDCPRPIRCELSLCSTEPGVYDRIEPTVDWLNARTLSDYGAALNSYVYQLASALGMNPQVLSMPGWTFGRRFIETVQFHGFGAEDGKAKMLLRACAETALRVNLAHTHMLRMNAGGDSPQRMRGGDTAWRRDIDYHYHLHYWQTQSGPEFASVGPHNDTSIPE